MTPLERLAFWLLLVGIALGDLSLWVIGGWR